MLNSLFISYEKFRTTVALLDQRSCAYADRRGGALRRTTVLWRGARGVHAQVDPFLPKVNLLALLRPQIFEHSCCEDPFTGGKLGASSSTSLTRKNFTSVSRTVLGRSCRALPLFFLDKQIHLGPSDCARSVLPFSSSSSLTRSLLLQSCASLVSRWFYLADIFSSRIAC